MKTLLNFAPLVAVTIVTACGGSNNTVARAPFADVYSAQQATATKNSIKQVLDDPGESLQGVTLVAKETFGQNGGPTVTKNVDPSAFKILRTATGYTITAEGKTFAFKDSDIDADGNFEVIVKNNNNDDTTLAYVFSPGRRANDALRSSTSAVVPLFFGIRTNSKGAVTANDSDGFLNGATVVGLETAPSDMPKTGSAKYTGNGRADFRKISVDYSNAAANQQSRVAYYGDAVINANFGTGRVSGSVDMGTKRESFTKTNSVNTDISGKNGKFLLRDAPIVQNGFLTEIGANAAGLAQLTADGVDVQTLDVYGSGRFYGNAAQQVGVVAAGESKSHTVSGVVVGAK